MCILTKTVLSALLLIKSKINLLFPTNLSSHEIIRVVNAYGIQCPPPCHHFYHHFIFYLFQDDEDDNEFDDEWGSEGLSISGKELKKLLGRTLNDYNAEHVKDDVCFLFYMPTCVDISLWCGFLFFNKDLMFHAFYKVKIMISSNYGISIS